MRKRIGRLSGQARTVDHRGKQQRQRHEQRFGFWGNLKQNQSPQ
jgi:hypothetical protein